jgi:hypothetical protein
MRKSVYQFPRTIQPSLIEIGDTVKVTHREERGITTTLTGTVGKRMDHGNTRYLMTHDGATLLAWGPTENKAIDVMLLHRPELTPEPLEMFDEIMERVGYPNAASRHWT